MASVVVVDYDPAWPGLFDEIHARVWPAVADVANRMEHVGSTAVPGLAAKPVIDIDVVVPPELIDEAIDRLADLGYEQRGDLGISGREAFDAPSGLPRHHLYLCREGSLALANHITLRDHLRATLLDARAYGDLKKGLAVEFADDIDGYCRGKTEFVLRVLEEHGFGREALDEIERQNQGPAG